MSSSLPMIELKHPQDLARLRRLALEAQGLLQTQAFGRGLPGARKAIEHIAYVQIDTISVVERAHHHVLYARVPGFRPDMTERMLRNRDIFEYWSHAAAFLPIHDFRFSLPYKHAIKNGQRHWQRNPDKKMMREMLARIRSDGPLRSRDLESDSKKQAGWWDWKPAKRALEQLYMQGELMVSKREGFQKTYDLTERVLPSGIDTSMPTMKEFAAHIVDQQLRCHGLASLKGLTYLRRETGLRKAVKNLVYERIAQGTLQRVKLPSGELFVLEPESLERRLPRLNKRMLILSPFDNSVIQRDRLRTLFDYEYQIECYLPEHKRQYGYFSLPLLYGDVFIGRMDCKAHRKDAHLEIKALHLEPLYLEQNGFDQFAVLAAFLDAVRKFCDFQQCDSVALTSVHPRQLTQALRKGLNTLC